MEIGGAETALLGLLNTFDYQKVDVSLLLLNPIGEGIKKIPSCVHLLDMPIYRNLVQPIATVIKQGHLLFGLVRLWGKIKGSHYTLSGYMSKQYVHKAAILFLPNIPGFYDLAISFIDPHYILAKKVNAKIKMAWLHTDFSRAIAERTVNRKRDYNMWNQSDFIVNVSESCKEMFDKLYPTLKSKSIVIENISHVELIRSEANAFTVGKEMDLNCVKLLSIGRFSYQKNFDNVPLLLKGIRDSGLDAKWYIIGFGGDEDLIRQRIAESGMENRIIILGKKENPYPYIKACDIYVQPSRYEGKSVTVREAQILCKPVVVTNYPTAHSQINDGVDGVIVPMDNEGCARGIVQFIKDTEKQNRLVDYLKCHDYGGGEEIDKLYDILQINLSKN